MVKAGDRVIEGALQITEADLTEFARLHRLYNFQLHAVDGSGAQAFAHLDRGTKDLVGRLISLARVGHTAIRVAQDSPDGALAMIVRAAAAEAET